MKRKKRILWSAAVVNVIRAPLTFLREERVCAGWAGTRVSLLGQGEGGRHTQAYKSSRRRGEKKWKKWKRRVETNAVR